MHTGPKRNASISQLIVPDYAIFAKKQTPISSVSWNWFEQNPIGTSYPKIATNFQSFYLAEIFEILL